MYTAVTGIFLNKGGSIDEVNSSHQPSYSTECEMKKVWWNRLVIFFNLTALLKGFVVTDFFSYTQEHDVAPLVINQGLHLLA